MGIHWCFQWFRVILGIILGIINGFLRGVGTGVITIHLRYSNLLDGIFQEQWAIEIEEGKLQRGVDSFRYFPIDDRFIVLFGVSHL